VSQRIQALEQSLGVSLFSRQGRVQLTDAGQRLYEYAQRILELHREAREEISGKASPIGGELHLAASSIPGGHMLPGLLSVFRKEFPQVQVRADVSDSDLVIQQVEAGKAHLGMVGRKPESSSLEQRAFAEDELVAVVPPGHAWAESSRITLKKLMTQPLVLREAGSGSRHCFEQALSRARLSLSDFQVAMELGGNEAVKEAVAQGLGVALLSSLAVERDRQAGTLHVLKISDAELTRDLYVIWDKRRALPPPARAFLRFLNSKK
jgi:DNA-binding transcriptional LysR family regulator